MPLLPRAVTEHPYNVAAVRIAIINSDGRLYSRQLRWRGLVDRNAVLEEIHRIKIAAGAIAIAAPDHGLNLAASAWLALGLGARSKADERGVLNLGHHATDDAHADVDQASHRHAVHGHGSNMPHIAAHVDCAGGQHHGASLRVDQDVGSGDPVSVLCDQIGHALGPAFDDRLRLHELRSLGKLPLAE